MILGFDFDNTLICYDQLFRQVALDKLLIPVETLPQKNAVRDYLRDVGQEDEWTRLQGEVYGGRILEAEPYPGVLSALQGLADAGTSMRIVSHKTKTPYIGEPWDLHAAARSWLEKYRFRDADGFRFASDHVFFEITKQEKIQRIVDLGCTHYIDDLPEILDMLPDHVERILFAPGERPPMSPQWKLMTRWEQLPEILGGHE